MKGFLKGFSLLGRIKGSLKRVPERVLGLGFSIGLIKASVNGFPKGFYTVHKGSLSLMVKGWRFRVPIQALVLGQPPGTSLKF